MEGLVTDNNDRPGHLARRFQQIAVAVFHAAVEEAGYDLTPVQYSALATVGMQPGIDQATLAGHVRIDDRASVGAYSGVHQYCRVGLEAFVGGYSVVVKDAMPFAIIQGNHAKCYGLNRLGMKRRGYKRDVIDKLNHAFHLLLSAKLNTTQAVEKIAAEITDCKEVELLVDFISSSKRGVVK